MGGGSDFPPTPTPHLINHFDLTTTQHRTTQAYSWALHLLALHPDAQQKLRDEALAILGPLPQAGNASYEQITRLVYGHAVATEALRLYPSVPSEGKWAFHDDVLPDGTP